MSTWWRPIAAALAVGSLALVFGALEPLQATDWWYPETGAYQLWILALTILAVWSFVARRQHPALAGSWIAAVALATSGLGAMMRHVVADKTPGDLLQGYLAGGRRVRRGAARIYDLRGLEQSVNASPLALMLFLPIAGPSDRQAIIAYLAISTVMLVGLVAAGAALLRARAGRIELRDVGVIVCTLTSFFVLQRSWRLGQIDTWVACWLACAWWAQARWPAGQGRRGRLGAALSALPLALAAGVKIGPAVCVAPVVQRAVTAGPGRADARRWLGWLVLWAAVLGLLAAALIGPRPCWRFVRNLGKISAASVSGNNYAVAARIATYGDRQRRAGHQELGAGERWAARGLGVAALAGLLWLTHRLRRQRLEVLMAIWLAALPLLSPFCWDIYLVWYGYLPWLLLWQRLVEARRVGGDHAPAARLLAVGAAGAYLLGGTAGNTVAGDFRTGVKIQLPLPAFLDELPVLGHLLTLGTLIAFALRDERRPSSQRSSSQWAGATDPDA